jgi:hypothetical protein
MNLLLKLENLAELIFSIIFAMLLLPFEWYWYWLFFFSPDVGFLGYAINSKVGAFTYNILHHKGIAFVLFGVGLLYGSFELQFAGLVLLGHSAFDRVMGYGLKYNDSFHHTHLGWIGKGAVEANGDKRI